MGSFIRENGGKMLLAGALAVGGWSFYKSRQEPSMENGNNPPKASATTRPLTPEELYGNAQPDESRPNNSSGESGAPTVWTAVPLQEITQPQDRRDDSPSFGDQHPGRPSPANEERPNTNYVFVQDNEGRKREFVVARFPNATRNSLIVLGKHKGATLVYRGMVFRSTQTLDWGEQSATEFIPEGSSPQ